MTTNRGKRLEHEESLGNELKSIQKYMLELMSEIKEGDEQRIEDARDLVDDCILTLAEEIDDVLTTMEDIEDESECDDESVKDFVKTATEIVNYGSYDKKMAFLDKITDVGNVADLDDCTGDI